MNILKSNTNSANSTHLARAPKSNQVKVETAPTDKVTFSHKDMLDDVGGGVLGGATIGVFVAEPIAFIGGVVHGIVTGKPVGATLVDSLGIAMGAGFVGGMGGALIGGIHGVFKKPDELTYPEVSKSKGEHVFEGFQTGGLLAQPIGALGGLAHGILTGKDFGGIVIDTVVGAVGAGVVGGVSGAIIGGIHGSAKNRTK